jgi:hypothetical protein
MQVMKTGYNGRITSQIFGRINLVFKVQLINEHPAYPSICEEIIEKTSSDSLSFIFNIIRPFGCGLSSCLLGELNDA